MAMNTVIQETRKQLGLTQEQVAEYLGVSTPAVSKWETGQTCPDITLLPRLARLLKTDLNTLFQFHETLTNEEIMEICKSIKEKGKTDGISAAFSLAEQYLKDYPYCMQLLYSAAFHLDALLSISGLSPEDHSFYEEKLSGYYEKLSRSDDPGIQNSANYMLASRFIRRGAYERAQTILDRMPDKKAITSELADKQMLQISLYRHQGKYAQAEKELEYALLTSVTRIQALLSQYTSLELSAENHEKAHQIAEKGYAFAKLFELWEYTWYVDKFSAASAETDKEAVLPLLSQMWNALTRSWTAKDTTLFQHIDWEYSDQQRKDMQTLFLSSLEKDPDYDFLRENPQFPELLENFRA